MAAIIQSDIERNSVLVGPILQVSREDLRTGDIVKLSSGNVHTSYVWTLAFAPTDVDGNASSATLSTPTQDSTEFTVDNVGAYLVRLVVDAGLLTEEVIHLRFRAATKFGKLRLVAAGERRDEVAVIPADIGTTGWADDQNDNLLEILSHVGKVSTSGRTFFVDANRGLNNLNAASDPTIAEDYGDYASINEAIIAASNLLPLPSSANPFVIIVQPGFYEENVDFLPHIHVFGLEDSKKDSSFVKVRATNIGAQAFTANLPAVGDSTYVQGIVFENTSPNETHALFNKSGSGSLYLKEVTLLQSGTGATTGPSLAVSEGYLKASDSDILVISSDEQIVSFTQEGGGSSVEFSGCSIQGPNAAELNSLLASSVSTTFENCKITATRADIAAVFGIKSSSDSLRILWSEISLEGGVLSTSALTVHPDGGIKGSPVSVEIQYSMLNGFIFFNNDNVAANDTSLFLGSSQYSGVSLTGASPALGVQEATTRGETLFYDGTTVPAPWTNVQGGLESIASVLNNNGAIGGGISLDSAYDGLDFSNSITGSGTGRIIYADAGAVQILAQDPPASPPNVSSTNGRLQVEGAVEVGGIDAPELEFRPNPYGTGPVIRLGQTVFPNIPITPHRSIAAGVISASSLDAPNFYNYNLRLQTESSVGASHGEVGRVILQGGDALGSTHDGSSVFLQGGKATGAGDGGHLYFIPGAQIAGPNVESKVWIAKGGSGASATLLAANAFVGGVDGSITFAISGVSEQTADILAADTIANVNAKLVALKGILAADDVGGKIRLTTESLGPNADIYFGYDDQSGALNTALGDFGPTAVFTSGTLGDSVAIECDSPNSLTVNGDLVVTGSITGSSASSYDRTVINNTYAVGTTEQYIAVENTSAAPISIYLPDTVIGGAAEGRYVIIKDEEGNAGTFSITVQVGNPQTGVIDGQLSLVLNTDYQSLTLVSNGLDAPNTKWSII